MIQSENRLKKRKQFNYLFKNGRHLSDEFLSIIYLPVKAKNFKVGYSVSKKVGKAVVRNKTKRRLKECVLSYSDKIRNSYYIVFVPKPKIVKLSFLEIKQEVYKLLSMAKLLNE